jgi:adhesin transport system outer membrane protein
MRRIGWGQLFGLRRFGLGVALCIFATGAAQSQTQLPDPTQTPLDIDFAHDPILGLARQQASNELFRATVEAAVRRHPATDESRAAVDEADAVVDGARESLYPSADIQVSTFRVLSREFSNDPNNIIERSRAPTRTDALVSVQQTLLDFGAGGSRVRAAGARLRAAGADLEATADRVALSTIASWYDVFDYRALTQLSEAYAASLRDMREAVEMRIGQGASAEADLAQADIYIARADTRLAQFRRQLANAEATFATWTGMPVPGALARAPAPALLVSGGDDLGLAAASNAVVRSAQANAESARQEARSVRAERLPQVTAGIDAGRYGVFETDRDYDIRGRVGLRFRLFGGADARASEYAARARAADARAVRIRAEAERDAAIALSDVQALERQLAALESSYTSSRRSRDAIVERFRVARGTLFDVATAEDVYFESATAYIQSLTALDAARYVLLSRTGRLLPALDIAPVSLGRRE